MVNAQKKVLLSLIGILFVFAMVLYFKKNPGSGTENRITDPHFLEGKQLATTYCSSCHKFPDPNLLPWRTWRFETLPAMAPFLGMDINRSSYNPARNPYLPENYYPSEPVLSTQEWKKIQDYYLRAAPQDLNKTERIPPIIVDTLFFSAAFSDVQAEEPPGVTAVKFDPVNRLIYASDFHEGIFMVLNEDLQLEHRFEIESTLADIQFLSKSKQRKPGLQEFLFTFIGHLYPSDAPYGSVRTGSYDPEARSLSVDSILVSDITRPVESQFADLNRDGLEDLLVNEFGHRMGSLFWVENKGSGIAQEKHILINTPGCIQSYITDYTQNGWPDILSLCTQTDQAIYIFSNKGEGEFERKKLLQFEVTAGSSSFELHDFNKDGHVDILYTSGDNADFSKVLKPYHGVYIYLNDGQDQFSQKWFYPVNGAYDAKARDFDLDGDLDIALISFFADYEKSPEEGFLFFKNEGDFSFRPYHHPAAKLGRWQTMDVADWTGNGRDDILLGNFSRGPSLVADSVQKRWEKSPHILLLENNK
ncbi:FG-GAP repeat domain-containing protein [Rhodohalobacter sp. 614A]|uniref:FG-GAP repeat domain-containing protein n=1 Tax=Rhodohalobacter sp. 614A TaxID=2908649 RepID=UPI001F384B8D|nr:VCBS repeat-containing protein [Rhodohalobacter sp. 614A]